MRLPVPFKSTREDRFSHSQRRSTINSPGKLSFRVPMAHGVRAQCGRNELRRRPICVNFDVVDDKAGGGKHVARFPRDPHFPTAEKVVFVLQSQCRVGVGGQRRPLIGAAKIALMNAPHMVQLGGHKPMLELATKLLRYGTRGKRHGAIEPSHIEHTDQWAMNGIAVRREIGEIQFNASPFQSEFQLLDGTKKLRQFAVRKSG